MRLIIATAALFLMQSAHAQVRRPVDLEARVVGDRVVVREVVLEDEVRVNRGLEVAVDDPRLPRIEALTREGGPLLVRFEAADVQGRVVRWA